MGRQGKSIIKRIIVSAFVAAVLLAAIAGLKLYHCIYWPNISLNGEASVFVYIPTGSNYSDVRKILTDNDYINNLKTFDWVAEKKNYHNLVKPGRYLLTNNMSNNEVINLLRSGEQHPINLTLTNIRTKEQLAGHIAERIESDSLSIINLLNNETVLSSYGHNTENAVLLFIPNTYEIFWNTTAEQLLARMHREYQRFWTDERKSKASALNMTPQEVGILASITQQETTRADEMHIIAGVYINRLRRGMPLQADPTIVFAHGDFTISRVLKRHLEIESPYNTYKYRGLPPGPINLPSPDAIESVLNYEKHDYLYFCAKDDFSGYHVFARTYQQHLINARRYQQELNRRNIMN